MQPIKGTQVHKGAIPPKAKRGLRLGGGEEFEEHSNIFDYLADEHPEPEVESYGSEEDYVVERRLALELALGQSSEAMLRACTEAKELKIDDAEKLERIKTIKASCEQQQDELRAEDARNHVVHLEQIKAQRLVKANEVKAAKKVKPRRHRGLSTSPSWSNTSSCTGPSTQTSRRRLLEVQRRQVQHMLAHTSK
jgi:hypothetical protein